jgi:DNA-binding GntR family transcriptional regulator
MVRIDARLYMPISEQLAETLTRMIYNRKLFLDEELPHPEILGQSLDIDPDHVSTAYQKLIGENLARFDHRYYVSHHDFIYPYYGQRLPIETALKNQGYEAKLKYHPSVIKTEGDLKLSGLSLNDQDASEKRIDYYADTYLFAVTYNYVPLSVVDNFDEFIKNNQSLTNALKTKTTTLTPVATYQAVTYPEEVAKAFKVPVGRAGLKISYDYYDDHDELIYVYQGYFTSWMDVQFFHDINTLESIAPK